MKLRNRMGSTWLLVPLLVACGDELPQITEIASTRVIGVRSLVRDGGTRATPQPGETVDVAFQLVAPEVERDNDDVASMFVDCTYPSRFTGLPLCQEFVELAAMIDPNAPELSEEDLEPIKCFEDMEINVEGVHGSCVFGDPTVAMEVSVDYDSPTKLIRGVICENGTPFFDARLPQLFGCNLRSNGTELLVHTSVPVELTAERANDNPDFARIELALNGRPWDAVDVADLPPGDDCRDAVSERGLLAVDAFDHELWIEMDADARERVDGAAEDLEFSLYVSGGKVERRFTVFEGDDPGVEGRLSARVPWVAPKSDELPEGGQLVTLYITLIDRRGGFDMAVRHACVFSEDPV